MPPAVSLACRHKWASARQLGQLFGAGPLLFSSYSAVIQCLLGVSLCYVLLTLPETGYWPPESPQTQSFCVTFSALIVSAPSSTPDACAASVFAAISSCFMPFTSDLTPPTSELTCSSCFVFLRLWCTPLTETIRAPSAANVAGRLLISVTQTDG